MTTAGLTAAVVPRARSRIGWPALMIGIAAVASLFVLGLVLVVFWLSFVEGQPGEPITDYTVDHYLEVFLDPFTYRVIYNTLVFSGVTLVVAMLIGVPIAWLLERTDFPMKTAVFTMMTMGLVVPGFAVAIGWQMLLHPRIGIINQWLVSALGIAGSPFDVGTLFGMGWVQGLSLAPVAFVMTAVVFRSMDASLEEAAQMGGANLRQMLARVTVPLVWPGVLAASIYIFTIGFAAFDIPAIIGLGVNLFTFSTYAYEQVSPAQQLPQYGPVAALSGVMVLLAFVLSWWYARVQRRAPQYAVITGKAYRPRLVDLGRSRVLAAAFVVVYLLLSQALPVAALIWASLLPFPQPPTAEALAAASLANYSNLNLEIVGRGVRNTAELMAITPTITVAVSFAISWVVLRSGLRFRQVFDFAAFLPHTVPTIVFSMAALLLTLFVLQQVVPIYGTIWVLVLVYVIARISYGTRVTNSAMIQIHRELEEAAQISGAGVGGIVRSVLAPLLKPAMMYAWIWIALLTYRELTLPVLLSTNDNLPLAVVVWNFWLGSLYGPSAATAVLMLVIMIPIVFAAWWLALRRDVALSR